nr:hypothetical protein [Tanacetum cinerariifolium]
MATTIEQQVALDEALVPSAQRDDILFSTIKVVSRHQNTQQYSAILPIELTTEDIRNTKAYKEYYACATGEAAPKPKASTRRKRGGSASSTTPPTPIATLTPLAALRLTTAAKGESSHWQYKFPLPVEGVPTARRMEIPLPGVCTAMMKKLPVKDKWQLH